MRLSKALRFAVRQIAGAGYSRPRGLIFLIGHMRCFSTLLSHQIGSNPDVAGYFEAHQKYRNKLDLLELAEKIERAGGHTPNGRFLFDKLLHPLLIRDAVLQRRDLKLILMVREPEATIRSILKICAGGVCSAEEAAGYYVRRLQQMREILERRRGRALYLEAEALIDDSASTLHRITEYLGLEVALTEAYERFPLTGRAKFGDPSDWIGQGMIVRHRGEAAYAGAPPQADAARAAYEEFRRYAQFAAESAILHPSTLDAATPGRVELKSSARGGGADSGQRQRSPAAFSS